MELFFNDLTDEAKERLLKVRGVDNPTDCNWDVCPIAILDFSYENLKGVNYGA